MYAVLNMNYKPSEFAFLPQNEKAYVIACINEKLEAEKRHKKDMEQRAKRSGSRSRGRRH